MKRIALITGGHGAERDISLRSAQHVAQYIDPDRYEVHVIDLQEHAWVHQASGQAVDLNDGTVTVRGQRINFEYAFVILHGTPAEDGKLQGQLERWGLPYSCCNTFVSALTFRKFQCNILLGHYGIQSPKAILVRKSILQDWNPSAIRLRYPLFVKPNGNGSSYGITKVHDEDELLAAVHKALSYDSEVIIEHGIEGREFTCGAIRTRSELRILPITEIMPKGEYYDYEAKYVGGTKFATPADLDAELTERCQAITRRIYEKLNCRGPIRVDFMMKDGTFYVIEVNTIPGLTSASLVPKQVKAAGWSMEAFVEEWMAATSHP